VGLHFPILVVLVALVEMARLPVLKEQVGPLEGSLHLTELAHQHIIILGLIKMALAVVAVLMLLDLTPHLELVQLFMDLLQLVELVTDLEVAVGLGLHLAIILLLMLLELEVDILAAMGEMLQQTDRMVELHLVGVLVGVVHLEGQAAMVARGSL
jgi:hypothetical protein